MERCKATEAGAPAVGRPRGCQLLTCAHLHDDVESQVQQQVADEDAQHIGCKVPGPVDQSKEGTVDVGWGEGGRKRV